MVGCPLDRIACLIAFVAIAVPWIAWAQEPPAQSYTTGNMRVVVEIDRDRMGVADRLRVRYEVEAPTQMLITFPLLKETIGPFQIVEERAGGPLPLADQMQLWRQEYVLEPEESGPLFLPSFFFTFHDPTAYPGISCVLLLTCDRTTRSNGVAPMEIRTRKIAIEVISVVPDNADVTKPRDIAFPIGLEAPPVPGGEASNGWAWRGWMNVVVAAIAMAALALFISRRRRRRTSEHGRRPAHEVALAALARLQGKDFIGQHRFEEFYVALSDILRRYLDWRFALRAPYRTTEEVGRMAQRQGGEIAGHAALLDSLLQESDTVKFASHEPSDTQASKALGTVRSFLENTADGSILAPDDIARAAS